VITDFSRLFHKVAPVPFTLAYEFARDGRLDAVKGPAITFTRGSGGTYFDSAGVLQTAGNDAARFDHDPASPFAALGLLIEGARTNVCLQSEDFSTTWTVIGTPIITANSAAAPDGNTTADTIEDDDGAAFEHVEQSITVANDSTEWTFSVYVKKDSDTSRFPEIQIRFTGGTAVQFSAQLNTNTGATTVRQESGRVSAQDAGDYWRFVGTQANNGTGNTTLLARIFPAVTTVYGSIETTATGSIIAWGAQVENADSPSSYIATTTVAVTRAVDVATISDLGLLNVAENTWLVEARTALGGGTQVLGQLDDGDENERIRVERNASDEIHFIVTDGGVDQADLNLGTVADDTDFKVAVAWAAGDFAGSLDGAAIVADAVGTVPIGLTTKRFGRDSAGSYCGAGR